MWAAGKQVDEWVLERQLGSGGMGEVWLAHRQSKPSERAAVKLMHRETQDAKSKKRFEREIEALRRLDHPTIVKPLGFGMAEVLYLAMEFIDGENLVDRIRRGAMPATELLPAMAAYASGLAAAHEAQIAHRDIKPANLMIGRDGTYRILDFGIAFDPDQTRLTGTGMITGTSVYIAPEALQGDAYNVHQADVYALGVVMYEMTVAKNAFPLDRSLDGMQRILKLVDDKHAAALNPGEAYDADLRAIIRGATEPDPEHRFESAHAMHHALSLALYARGPVAPSTPMPMPREAPEAPRIVASPPPPTIDRSMVVWLVGAAVAIGAFLGGLVALAYALM